MKQIILVFFFKNCTTMHFFAFFSHIYIIIISSIFLVPAQWSQWSKHTWFWSSRVRTPPGARLDKLQILEKFQIQTNFRFRQILDKKIGYHYHIAYCHTLLFIPIASIYPKINGIQGRPRNRQHSSEIGSNFYPLLKGLIKMLNVNVKC